MVITITTSQFNIPKQPTIYDITSLLNKKNITVVDMAGNKFHQKILFFNNFLLIFFIFLFELSIS